MEEVKAAQTAWSRYQDKFPFTNQPEDYFMAGYLAALETTGDSGITFLDYLRQRHPTINALTAAEAKILGLVYPLISGWVDRHADMIIPADMVRQLTETRINRQAQNKRN